MLSENNNNQHWDRNVAPNYSILNHNCQKTGPFETKVAVSNINYRTFNSTNLLKSDSSFYEENFIVISEILRNLNFLNFIKIQILIIFFLKCKKFEIFVKF